MSLGAFNPWIDLESWLGYDPKPVKGSLTVRLCPHCADVEQGREEARKMKVQVRETPCPTHAAALYQQGIK